MNKKGFFFLLLLLLFMVSNFESCDLLSKTQEWALQNYVGDIVMVEVAKGDKSSTFSEIGGGWYIHIQGMDPIHLRVDGTINGATWTFATLTGSGPNVNITGNGSGTADAPYPDGSYVSGSLQITIQRPEGSTTGYDYWNGRRTK
jgi:hypothetical protein